MKKITFVPKGYKAVIDIFKQLNYKYYKVDIWDLNDEYLTLSFKTVSSIPLEIEVYKEDIGFFNEKMGFCIPEGKKSFDVDLSKSLIYCEESQNYGLFSEYHYTDFCRAHCV